MPKYSVTPHAIDYILVLANSGEIAIPEIQRPFVWDTTKVRNLLDSLYNGYPVGYLIAWKNPDIKLKNGETSAGKRILIDGQQRVTALMAALLGTEVLTKNYNTRKIRIAFNPIEERFEVRTPIYAKDPAWIDDISTMFDLNTSIFSVVQQYADANPSADQHLVSLAVEKLMAIKSNHVGIIDLADDLDIETVTEIFIRVNSAGTELSQADFAMSKIAVNESFGGQMMRKAIDYFCHLAVSPEFFTKIEKSDAEFAQSEYFDKIKWLKDTNEDIYDPKYTDMLRVAFTSEFGRGRLQDLVALLSGRNFETKENEEVIAEESFAKLNRGIHSFINKTHFDRLTMILRSSGFIVRSLIRSQNAVNFAYVIFLKARSLGLSASDIERLVRRWFVMSILTQRYSGAPETTFDYDIRQIEGQGLIQYIEMVIENELPPTFWDGMLPQVMETSASTSPYFIAYQAAQAKIGDLGFLSKHITVKDLLLNKGDKHHLFPRKYLMSKGLSKGKYNQIANYVLAQSEINIAISAKPPEMYFSELVQQCKDGQPKYGGITAEVDLRKNLETHCIPLEVLDGEIPEYEEFLALRRKLMAQKIKEWFEKLSQ